MTTGLWAALPLALVFVGGSAVAGGAGAMPVPLFTGLYVGVQGGGGSASSDTCVESNFEGDQGCSEFYPGYNAINMSGPYVGAHIGYDFATSPMWRLGIEGALNLAGIDGDGEQYWDPSGISAAAHESIDSFGTVNGRIGYVMGNWMPYVTGGLAFGGGTRTAVETYDTYFWGTSKGSGSHAGWDIGVGAEWAINPHWSLKAEYKYIDLGRANYPLTEDSYFDTETVLGIDVKIQTAEFGISYRF